MLQQIEEASARVRELEETSREAAAEAIEAKAEIIAAANAAIDEIIRASGLTYGEILGMRTDVVELSNDGPTFGQPVKPARKRSGGDHPRYALIGDPNCTYTRGPVPLWMKSAMIDADLDPADKGAREAFRTKYMERV